VEALTELGGLDSAWTRLFLDSTHCTIADGGTSIDQQYGTGTGGTGETDVQ